MTIIFKTLLARVIDEFEHFVSSTSPYGLRFDSRLLVVQFHKILALFTLVPRNSEKKENFCCERHLFVACAYQYNCVTHVYMYFSFACDCIQINCFIIFLLFQRSTYALQLKWSSPTRHSIFTSKINGKNHLTTVFDNITLDSSF